MNYEHKDMKLMMITRFFLIAYQTQKLSEIPQHTRLGGGMVLIIENCQDTVTRVLGCLY